MKKTLTEIEIRFEPNPTFKEEWLEFLEQILFEEEPDKILNDDKKTILQSERWDFEQRTREL